MRIAALLMAGGQGQRMRACGAEQPKPLVEVRGLPMIERNLLGILGRGFSHITVAVPGSHPPLIRDWVEGRGRDLADALGAELAILVEAEPLGTIGCAARLANDVDVLLVVNADNLSVLDLGELVERHGADGDDMTVAVHHEPWCNPHGEVEIDGDRIIHYREKPVRQMLISSGTYVLGSTALGALTGDWTDAPTLVETLLSRGARVGAFHHEAPWVDVNDSSAIARAEALIAAHSDVFECWSTAPDIEVAGVLLESEQGVLLEHRPADAALHPAVWDTPGGKLEPGESASRAARREIHEELGLELGRMDPVVVFDDVDLASRRVVRHHVFAAAVEGTLPAAGAPELAWLPRDGDRGGHGLGPINSVVTRSLAARRGDATNGGST